MGVSDNLFDGSRLAIWVNGCDFVTVRNSVFRNYAVAVGMDANDVAADLTIVGNDLPGGSYTPTSANS